MRIGTRVIGAGVRIAAAVRVATLFLFTQRREGAKGLSAPGICGRLLAFEIEEMAVGHFIFGEPRGDPN
jgi:hypothetical protein